MKDLLCKCSPDKPIIHHRSQKQGEEYYVCCGCSDWKPVKEVKRLDMLNINDYQIAMRRVIAIARADYQDGHFLGVIKTIAPLRKKDRSNLDIAHKANIKKAAFWHLSTIGVVYDNVMVTLWQAEKNG